MPLTDRRPLFPAVARFAVPAFALALGLAGCSSTPTRDATPAARAPAPAAPATATVERAGRRGGYYKDDGPGDTTPPNLDDIPDAEPRIEPLHRYANRPYNVFGQDYVPATELAAYRERGRASWYGRRFHGKPTSSGEPYDMYGMTAAHPTLPIPSYARITNPANERSVVVRINDRGPFHKERVIDLSYTAAYRLGYANAGSAVVEVEAILPAEIDMMAAAKPVPPMRGREPVLKEIPPPERRERDADAIERLAAATPPQAAPSRGGVFLQLGTFSSAAKAEGFLGVVRDEFEALADRLQLHGDGNRYRLHLGPFDSAEEARSEGERIAAVLKIRPFVVTR